MKKFLFILIMALVCVASAAAINLKDAFSALSKLPNVSVKENLDLKDLTNNRCPVKLDSLKVVQVAIAYDLDAEKIMTTANGAYTILNQIPFQPGMNHLLMAVMSGEWGSVIFVDAIVKNNERDAIQAASIEMKGNYLNMAIPKYFNIAIN